MCSVRPHHVINTHLLYAYNSPGRHKDHVKFRPTACFITLSVSLSHRGQKDRRFPPHPVSSLSLSQTLMYHLWFGKSLHEAISTPIVFVDSKNAVKFEPDFDKVQHYTWLL